MNHSYLSSEGLALVPSLFIVKKLGERLDNLFGVTELVGQDIHRIKKKNYSLSFFFF